MCCWASARRARAFFLEPGAGATARDSLRAIRDTMRLFRYCTQKALEKFNLEAGKMETLEGLLRGMQNAFSSADGVSTDDIEKIFILENELAEKFAGLRNLLHETPNAPPPKIPAKVLFAESIGDALELSHRTNDQIRGYFEATRSSSNLRAMLSDIGRKGGSREVEFSAGVGALIGLGFAVLERVRHAFPGLKVLLLAGMPLQDELERAKNGGAAGYVPKSLPWDELTASIRRAMAGGAFEGYEPPARRGGILSPREEEILKYLNLGKTQDEIAIILGIGRETIKTHIRTLKEKLSASSSAGAVGRAYELGILRP